MSDERLALMAAGCVRARRRMDAEHAFHLLGWCEELLAELARWRPRQARMDMEDVA